jgi:two-component system, OmpR family, osmolarity sensor histidine kinase EnvZ
MAFSLKPFLPKSLFGRAALILVVPVIVVQFLVSIGFIQRHYQRVTEQLTSAVVREMTVLLAPSAQQSTDDVYRLAGGLDITFQPVAARDVPSADSSQYFDLAGRYIIETLRRDLRGVAAIDLRSDIRMVTIYVQAGAAGPFDGPLRFDISRGRFAASNPHQLLVLMAFSGIVMTVIAYLFLRNQLTPITRLAAIAAAFGRGQNIAYSPRGATEVRAAGLAFLAMRARIERQIETRTLMLSGVSHDLRSPLTRLKLGLALLPETEDTAALQSDIADMERLLDEFLAFARGDALEDAVLADPAQILHQVADKAARLGGQGGITITITRIDPCLPVLLRPDAVGRALENLVGNARRYGTQIHLSLRTTPKLVQFVVEDNGPGIPADRRLRATEPFARLDAARNPNQGGGVGLGLAIAADVARSHGGELLLEDSTTLGGLRAELRIAR